MRGRLQELRTRLQLPLALEELEQAFRHDSYVHENPEHLESNERLEFLGDAVIELAIREHLFKKLSTLKEGGLTKLKATMVSGAALAEKARALGLGRCLLLGKGEEETGGRNRASNLSAAFEALIGVVFLHEGYERAKRFVLEHLHLESPQPVRETV